MCYTKADRDPVSVLLEIKGKPEILLFESGAIAELCKYQNIVKETKTSSWHEKCSNLHISNLRDVCQTPSHERIQCCLK